MTPSRNGVIRIVTAALLLATVLVVTGCATAPAGPSATTEANQPEATELDQLLSQAARAQPAQAAALYLQVAWRYFSDGDPVSAQRTADLIDGRYLNEREQLQYQLLAAELALAAGDQERADQLLAGLQLTAQTSPEVAARLCALSGDYLCAANRLIASSGEDTASNELIWRYMGLAPGTAVEDQAVRAADPVSRGWWQLKLAMLRSHTLAERQQAASFWRQAWANHPAALAPPAALQKTLTAGAGKRQVALLLPLSGPLTGAGEAVRDGVISAYLRELASRELQLRFYDTQSAPLAQLYEQILTDGNDVIIGPLRKALVDEFNALNPELPVLALNYLDESAVVAPSVSQLGLAIEDEASSISRVLNETGYESLLVFHNYEDWSLRARRALTESWSGRLTVAPFTDIRTVTEAVGTAMDVAASQQRHEELSALFSDELEFLPRARQDIQAIVALIDNVEANALVPALQFHFADQLPVYASSQVVRGARRAQLTELNGFLVSELPWYINDDSLYQSMREPFALVGNRFSALYALGADALRIALMIDVLPRDGTSVMLGSTGALSLQADGRLKRQLSWARVRNGEITRAASRASTD